MLHSHTQPFKYLQQRHQRSLTMNLSLLAGAVTLLMTATMGAGIDPGSVIAEFCPGVDVLSVAPDEPGRYYLYRATLAKILDAYLAGGCGRFYMDNEVCGCTFRDSFVYRDAHFTEDWSFNKVENRLNVHLYERFQIDPYYSAYDYIYDFRDGQLRAAGTINYDDYLTYFITQGCNATSSDPADQIYRVWTNSPTPSPATQNAIDAFLLAIGVTDLPYIDQNNCTYPASTYTTPETQTFSE